MLVLLEVSPFSLSLSGDIDYERSTLFLSIFGSDEARYGVFLSTFSRVCYVKKIDEFFSSAKASSSFLTTIWSFIYFLIVSLVLSIFLSFL